MWIRNGHATLLILVLICFNIHVHATNSKIVSCEGFVEPTSDLLTNFNPSKIQVKLFTAQGNLRYETECNPSGYYMIPIYKKGRYIIRVFAPDGWVLDPEFQEIEVDPGGTSSCTTDVNFKLFGFKITGRVINYDKSSGPNGLNIGLFNENGHLLNHAITKDGGLYEFKVTPGKYYVAPSNETAHCLATEKISAHITDRPISVKPDIKIIGHNLNVFVKDEAGRIVPNATITLVSPAELKQFAALKNPQIAVGNEGSTWFYSTITDLTDGRGFYPCIPSGSYKINVSWTDTHIALVFEELSIDILNANLDIILESTGFNLYGRILAATRPISGAKIKIGGIEVASSNEDGNFELKSLKKEVYELTVEKEHFRFDSLSVDLMRSSSAITRPDFIAKEIEICGGVKLENKRQPLPAIDVFLDDSHIETLNLDDTGSFCHFFPLGNYLLKVSDLNTVYNPSAHFIELKDEPFFDAFFVEIQARISGRILTGDISNDVLVKLLSKKDRKEVASTNIQVDGNFLFQHVSPGHYIAQIIDPLNIFWWENNEQEVDVIDKDVANLVFRQLGYKHILHISHAAKMSWWPASGKTTEKSFELNEGLNELLVLEKGKYIFSIDSCYQFNSSNEFTIPSRGITELHAINAELAFSISSENAKQKYRENIDAATAILSDLSSGQETQLKQTKTGKFVFRLDQISHNKEYKITPVSTQLLFRPNSHIFKFDGKCNPELIVFTAEEGKFISGGIQPPILNVEIIATHRDDASNVFHGQTDSRGKYRLGPLHSEKDYIITAFKEGFVFIRTESDPYEFSARKLSQLKITFLDIIDQTPLPDVLLSLSGSSNFRSSNFTDHSGQINFIGLAPGQYFIRPILREYKFELDNGGKDQGDSSSFIVAIEEGHTQEIILKGKRFAYSVYGKVTPLGGTLPPAIHVEAISHKCAKHQEEDLVSETKDFHIKALRPNCSYLLSLKNDDGEGINSFPPVIEIKMEEKDRIGANFVIMPDLSVREVTIIGKLEFEEELESQISSLRLTLSRGTEVIRDLTVHSPASIFLFTIEDGIDQNIQYSIGIERSEAKRLKIEPVSAPFQLNSYFKYIKLMLRPEKRSSEVEVSRANLIGLLLIMIGTFIYYNKNLKNLNISLKI